MSIDEKVVYRGTIFEVVEQQKTLNGRIKTLEIARRSPGVRLIIKNNGKILITKEHRHEHRGYDYRLPGGKVFDTLAEYEKHRSKNLTRYAKEAAKKECQEETGLITDRIRLFGISRAGATIEWDLYYFVVDSFHQGKQKPEESEDITYEWMSYKKARELCMKGEMKEDRSVGMLLRFLNAPEKY